MFEKLKRFVVGSRLADERVYEEVVRELRIGIRRQGLWAKAFADADGNEEKAQALYLRYRAQSIRDENEINRVAQEQADSVAAEARAWQQLSVESKLRLKLIEKGYIVKKAGSGWAVREPLGGKLKFKSDDEFKEYAVKRGISGV
jgi:hypothetical protein